MSCEIPEIDEHKLAEMARTCACFNFRKASRSVTQLFDQILAPTGLRSTQLVILITGLLLGPSSIARLARELVMDRSTLTRNLRPLMNMGLVRFTQGEGGKQKTVEVTVNGQAALLKSAPYWERAQSHLVERFGVDAWNRIMADLSAIVDATRASAV
ncbi:MAG: MarR family winged helix-turn-helix transcriptional regulator [Pirellulales bacterium]